MSAAASTTKFFSLNHHQHPSIAGGANQRCLADELELNNTNTTRLSKTGNKPQIIGHRGSVYEAVENTLASFGKCLDHQCHGVELDVFLLKDDTLVVFHGAGTDANPGHLLEYCGVDRCITDLTWPEAQELRFQRSELVPAFAGTTSSGSASLEQFKIPTLEQVLLLFRGTDQEVKIELKGKGTVVPSIEVVERLGMVEQCTFSSFYHERLVELRQYEQQQQLQQQRDDNNTVQTKKYRTGAIFKGNLPRDYLQLALRLEVDEVHLRYDTCSARRVRDIHRAGFKSMAWFRGPKAMTQDMRTFRDVESEQHLYELVAQTGVGQLCVNRPGLAMELLRE
jgi:glycerophosphoryl diester phosphodiesterase